MSTELKLEQLPESQHHLYSSSRQGRPGRLSSSCVPRVKDLEGPRGGAESACVQSKRRGVNLMTSTNNQFPKAATAVGVVVRASVCLAGDTTCPTALILVKTSKIVGRHFFTLGT